jgi:predicted alpha/beta superfamily hydrolase
MFQNYVLGSPSLWFDDHLLLRMEADYARTHKDLPAKIHMVAGSYESFGPTERHYKDNDLAGTMRQFDARLKSRGYPGLTVSSEVAEGEDHFTVFHDVAARGLLRVLPGSGPYRSG